jgi:hypothetical protein
VIAALVFLLCVLTSTACAALLIRGYSRSRTRLLMWSSLGFVGLAANNLLLVWARLVDPGADLGLPRVLTALTGVSLILFGSIVDAD